VVAVIPAVAAQVPAAALAAEEPLRIEWSLTGGVVPYLPLATVPLFGIDRAAKIQENSGQRREGRNGRRSN